MNRDRRYIVAVSGGVDSVVLLDMLAHRRLSGPQFVHTDSQLIVAHFDHGIREDSSQTAQLVQELTQKYELPYEAGAGNLGAGTSEQAARDARYAFLKMCQKKYSAEGIITAHHQDDVLETALINLLRGTGWRGLASLRSTKNRIRPLLNTPKSALLAYAKTHHLVWHEDSTNQDQSYLRNYIRHTLLPHAQSRNAAFRDELLLYVQIMNRLRPRIEEELAPLLKEAGTQEESAYKLPRYECIMWPRSVLREVVYEVIMRITPQWYPDSAQLERLEFFIKTGRVHKVFLLHKHLHVRLEKHAVLFQKV